MPPGVVPAAAGAATAPAYAHTAPPTPLLPKRMHVIGIIGIIVVISLAVLLVLAMPTPDLPDQAQAVGFRIGTLLGLLGLPFLVAYPIAGRRKARNPNLFAGLFCGLGVVMLFLNLAGSLPSRSFQPETTDQAAARLMREAAGLQPVRKSIFGEPKTDTMLRDLFKQVIAINKEYQAAADKLDMSAIAQLNTPQSFADPDSATEALRELHAAYDLDARQEQRMSELLENFRHSLNALSTSDRDALLKGFNNGLEKTMPTRRRAVSTEKTWIATVDDVYSYARDQHPQLRLQGGKLLISDEAVRQEFNNRIHAMNDARQEFLQAKSSFDRLQGETLKKSGISRDQTGLH